MKQLLELYEHRLKNVVVSIKNHRHDGSIYSYQQTARYYEKQRCYNAIIDELKMLIDKCESEVVLPTDNEMEMEILERRPTSPKEYGNFYSMGFRECLKWIKYRIKK